jgi:hypothetical protein
MGVDLRGFTRLNDVCKNARGLGVHAFCEAFPQHALIFSSVASASDAAQDAAPVEFGDDRDATHASDVGDDRAVSLVYGDRVAFLRKRPENPFPDMISLGRASNNDVVVRLSSISKIHAVFMRSPSGGWTITDSGSTNGTYLNDTALAPRIRESLTDGDRIRLGLDLKCVFLEPESLFERVTG